MKKNKCLIVAKSKNNIIGKNNKMPWYLKKEIEHFRDITSGNAVVMGRITFESIGNILSDRINIVISTKKKIWRGKSLYCIFARWRFYISGQNSWG